MKSLTTVLLSASLVLNAAIAVLILAGYSSAPAPRLAPVAAPAEAAPPKPAIDASVWPGLATGDLPAQVARLRDAGFPREIVRAILSAQVRERFAARRRALDATGDARQFWLDQNLDAHRQAAFQQLAREERAALRELLGADADSSDPMRDLAGGQSLTFLAPEKAVDVRQIQRDFEERRADLYASGFVSGVDNAKLAALEKEQLAAIAAVLTPQELQEYRLRISTTADTLRNELLAFNPTEEEFRALFRLRDSLDDRFGLGAGLALSADLSRQRGEAMQQTNEQFKATLTPERAAEFERASDYNYRRASQLFARLELPRENLDRVWQVQKEFEQQRAEAGRARDGGDFFQRVAALQQEAAAKIAPLVGGAGNMEVYKQYGGSWLQPIARRPAAK